MEGTQVTTAETEAAWLQSGLQVTYLSSAVPHMSSAVPSSGLSLNECDLF